MGLKLDGIYLPVWYQVGNEDICEYELSKFSEDNPFDISEIRKSKKISISEKTVHLGQSITDMPNNITLYSSDVESKISKIVIFWEAFKPVIIMDIEESTLSVAYWKTPYTQEEWEIIVDWKALIVEDKWETWIENIKAAISEGKSLTKKLLWEDLYIKQGILYNLEIFEKAITNYLENNKKES